MTAARTRPSGVEVAYALADCVTASLETVGVPGQRFPNGLALTFAILALHDERYAAAAHRAFAAASTYAASTAGLWTGVGGMYAALSMMHGATGAYASALRAYDDSLRSAIAASYVPAPDESPVAYPVWDLVSGSAGIAIAAEHGAVSAAAHDLRARLRVLATASWPTACARPLPRSDTLGVDIGAAHGVWGVIAAAAGAGCGVAAAAELAAAARLLLVRAPNWEAFLTLDGRAVVPHNGWCYGAYGIGLVVARVVRTARRAGAEREALALRDAFLAAFHGFAVAQAPLRYANDPTLCHGAAGRYVCARFLAREFADDPRSATLAALAISHRDVALAHARELVSSEPGAELDAGLLTGAAGIALALFDDDRVHARLVGVLGGPVASGPLP